jgi:hypothetical protein
MSVLNMMIVSWYPLAIGISVYIFSSLISEKENKPKDTEYEEAVHTCTQEAQQVDSSIHSSGIASS